MKKNVNNLGITLKRPLQMISFNRLIISWFIARVLRALYARRRAANTPIDTPGAPVARLIAELR